MDSRKPKMTKQIISIPITISRGNHVKCYSQPLSLLHLNLLPGLLHVATGDVFFMQGAVARLNENTSNLLPKLW